MWCSWRGPVLALAQPTCVLGSSSRKTCLNACGARDGDPFQHWHSPVEGSEQREKDGTGGAMVEQWWNNPGTSCGCSAVNEARHWRSQLKGKRVCSNDLNQIRGTDGNANLFCRMAATSSIVADGLRVRPHGSRTSL
eukprot:346788-Chlamydomonas_euryale.AAC.6